MSLPLKSLKTICLLALSLIIFQDNYAQSLVRSYQKEKEAFVFIVEQQGLNRGDDDFRPTPVVAILLVDDGLEVVRENPLEGFQRLVFELQPVDEE